MRDVLYLWVKLYPIENKLDEFNDGYTVSFSSDSTKNLVVFSVGV